MEEKLYGKKNEHLKNNPFVMEAQEQPVDDSARQQAIADAIAARDMAYARFEDVNTRYENANMFERAEAARAEIDQARAAAAETQAAYDVIYNKVTECEGAI